MQLVPLDLVSSQGGNDVVDIRAAGDKTGQRACPIIVTAPAAGNQPFANAVQQRMEMIAELKAIRMLLKEQNGLLKEQNRLLRSDEVKVADSPKKR